VALGYDALAVTCHNALLRRPDLTAYAEARGVLLLPGAEITLEGGHVVVINPGFSPRPKGYGLADVRRLKTADSLFIAAHPYFFPFPSLGAKLVPLLPWIDAIEVSSYHNAWIDFNRKAVRTAQLHGKPLVGDSDCHALVQFGTTYTLVDADRSLASIVRAVRAGRCEVRTEPMPLRRMARILGNALTVEKMRRIIENRW
jgi:predicted metal-dependent phosphoesterase TrpH